MRLLLLLLVVPALLLAYWLYRQLWGRPMRRADVNTASGLLLMAYFVATAGLGVFWVAHQELPVFDWHYVFGYVTTLLVVFHVAYNGDVVLATMRRASPAPLVTDQRKRFRPVLRLFAWVALFGGVIALSFYAGYEEGQLRVSLALSSGERGAGEGGEDAGWRVALDGKQVGVARLYHRRSSFVRGAPWDRSTGFEWRTPPTYYKAYPDAQSVALPPPTDGPRVALSEALRRRARRADAVQPGGSVSLRALAHVLHHTNGLTSPPWKRAAPSGGALFPTVTYVLVRRVDGLAPGLYHYAVDRHALHRLADDVAARVVPLVEGGSVIEDAPLTVLFSAIFHRTAWKYGNRGYRYALLDTGHVVENLALIAATHGLATVPLARFDDARLSTVLGIDGLEEAPMLVVAVGQPAEGAGERDAGSRLRVGRDVSPDLLDRLLPLVHRATSLERVAGMRRPDWTGVPADGRKLPAATATEADTAASIRARRSERSYRTDAMPLETFASLLRDAVGPAPVGGTDAVRVHVLVNRVAGLTPGGYRYEAESHALTLLRPGDFSGQAGPAALDQAACGAAQVVVALTFDWARSWIPSGDRGYRDVCLEAGARSERLYLSATARGVSACAMGAFYEDEVGAFFGLDHEREGVVLLVALGVRP